MASTTEGSTWPFLNFLQFEKGLNGESKLPLHAKRKEAFDLFSIQGFPSKDLEEWRYTDISPIQKSNFTLPTKVGQVSSEDKRKIESAFVAPQGQRVVFVDGFYREELSHKGKSGITISTIREASSNDRLKLLVEQYLGKIAPKENPFVSLNTAFLQDGLVVHIPKGTALKEPLEIIFYTSSQQRSVISPRVLIVAEENTEASIIEHFLGTKAEYLTNAVLECVVKANAKFSHYRIQDEGENGAHVSTIHSDVYSSGIFRTHTFSFGGKIVRNHVNAGIQGSGSHTAMYGLSVLSDDQHVDNQTLLNHIAPHCESHELYKGIYADKSSGAFVGTIIVQPGAQKTNAIQSNRALLLSNEATINAQPQLKIWADDVKCTHGATIGQLDEKALFYIRSRGVDEASARAMLIHAFASEVISQVAFEPLQERLEERLMEKLA